MVRLIPMLGAWLATAAAAVEPAAPTAPADTAAAQPVKVVTIDPNAKEPVCRRAAPTGSRIKKEFCEMPATASDTAAREQLRRDIDEVRTRQVQAQQQAIADALRRRSGR